MSPVRILRKTSAISLSILLSAFMFAACGKEDASDNGSDEKTEKDSGDGVSEEDIKAPEPIIDLGDVKLELVKIEAHPFTMSNRNGGSYDNEVPHYAALTKDFYIGKTEVTQAQWKAVMGTTPSNFKGDDLPVECVSWNKAMEFCEKLTSMGKAPKGWKFSLPTETQWEYAARGGNRVKGYYYSGSSVVSEVAWYDDNSGSRTHPVGQKKPNELGLYDMSGNVSEWCLDDYNDDSSKLTAEFTRTNERYGPRRSVRGGHWDSGPRNCRSLYRISNEPGNWRYDLGFRVALVPESY